MRWNVVQLSQINIDHDFVATNQVNSPLDELNRNGETVVSEFLCVRHISKLALDLPSLQISVICGLTIWQALTRTLPGLLTYSPNVQLESGGLCIVLIVVSSRSLAR
jgi:hypothetical protein